jgi:hypothetical protein
VMRGTSDRHKLMVPSGPQHAERPASFDVIVIGTALPLALDGQVP